MNTSDPVYWEPIDGGVARLVLNRPDHGNALSLAASRYMVAAIDALLASKPRAILISAKGPMFCAGGDIAEFIAAGSQLSQLTDDILRPLIPAYVRLASAPCPVVSAVNGAVAGAGIGLALCADFVLGASSMKLRTGYAAIGLSPDLGASYFLGRRAGTVKAQQWFMLNETLNAQQCLDHHVVDKLCPDAELELAATELAVRLANHAPGSMRSIKALFTGLPSRDLQAHLDLEHHFMKQCADSAEAREGVQAFLEKRPAVF